MTLMPTHTHTLTHTYVHTYMCHALLQVVDCREVGIVLSMTEECYEFDDKLSVELRQCKPKLGTQQASEQ